MLCFVSLRLISSGVAVMSVFALMTLGAVAVESKQASAVAGSETEVALKTFGLVPYNTSALGDRQVLLFVHGIAPEAGALFGWGHLIQSMQASHQSDDFFKRYKVYFFSYDPADSVSVNAEKLKSAIGYLADRSEQRSNNADFANPPTTIKAVALSLGGLIYQQAMADVDVVNTTEQVITLGSPLHGTPIANPPWMRSALKKALFLSPLRFGRRTIYRLVEDKFPSFKTDFCWDNTDQLMPTDFMKAVPCQRSNISAVARSKFVTYATYFGVDKQTQALINDALALPDDYADTLLETTDQWRDKSPTSKHGMMEMMQKNMARLPVNSNNNAEALLLEPDATSRTVPALYALSDGVSPVYSQLWLGRFMPSLQEMDADKTVASGDNHSIQDNRSKSNIQSDMWYQQAVVQEVQPESLSASVAPLPEPQWVSESVSDSNPRQFSLRSFASPDSASPSFKKKAQAPSVSYSVETSWHALATLRKKSNVRLFYGLDHRDWTEGTTRWKNVSVVSDLLHPNQPKQPLHQWLLNDLMQPAPTD